MAVLLTIVLSLATLYLAGRAMVAFRREWARDQDAVRISGVVVALEEEERPNDPPPAWFPVIEYTRPDGVKAVFTSQVGHVPRRHDVGDEVELLFTETEEPEARTTALLDRFPSTVTYLGIATAIGGFALVAAIAAGFFGPV